MEISSKTRDRAGRFAALGLSLVVGACANMPNAKVDYYLTKSEVSFKVTRSYICDADHHVLVTNAVTPVVSHFADLDSRRVFDLSKLHGSLSDTDFKVEFFDDGRLKSINSSSTGQGEAILKAAITTVGALIAFTASNTYATECGELKKIAADKPLMLTFDLKPDLAISTKQQFKTDEIGNTLVVEHGLSGVLGTLHLEVTGKECRRPVEYQPKGAPQPTANTFACPTAQAGTPSEEVLSAREPASVKFKISASPPGGNTETIWEGSVPVAQFGVDYPLPLPKPSAFGKEAIAATFLDSGKLSSIQFVTNTGGAAGLNALNAGLAATAPTTTAQKAEQLKAEADLLAQQQRLATCRADPKNCK